MPPSEEAHIAKKADVDFYKKLLAKAEAKLAKAKAEDAEEWRRNADWLLRLVCTRGDRNCSMEVRVKMEQLNRNEAFMSYYEHYCDWVFSEESFQKAVQELNNFEVANGLGEHQVLSYYLILWLIL